ncbi:MAG: hypothetical protein F7C07_08465 [Desulfurococcales archaeon]|nr:hypothetical protein [Desulfurococcales archaeon]
MNWCGRVKLFFWGRAMCYRRVRAVRKVREVLEKHPELPAGTAVGSVRQDRDSR